MRFKIDENLPCEIAYLLRDHGYDALTVSEQNFTGQVDNDISLVCRQEKRTLLTLDVGFADIRTYPPKDYPGIIVFRLRSQAKPHVLSIVQSLVTLLPEETVAHRLWIVEEHKIRIRE